MAVLFNNLRTYINTLPSLERIALFAVFFILLCYSVANLIMAYYNAKKLSLKIWPIIFSVLFLVIVLFIAFA